ncbi:hypothetical protein M0812_08264 [Anaeramoeba flamelloides]|uniref:BZIP domain-containing protein n=1 Tax=Anaeramoeba flamelloides TaxID=1746091 RepID=A0AAV8A2V7_9EUKA|nr:hypothetical protein M0812_08264 [Anaeramoeba flamelloides]
MTELNLQEKSPVSLNSPNFDELLRSDLTPRSDEMINDYSSPLTSPIETPFQTTTTNNKELQEEIEMTNVQEHLVEREYRPRKRSRKITKRKKINPSFKERNWNDQNKTKLEEQVFELTLRELRTKQKNLTIDEYVKLLEEEVCKLSVENIVQTAKVDALNEERTQTHELVLDLRETNTKYRQKIKRFSNQNKKLKIKLRNLQGQEQNFEQSVNQKENVSVNENRNLLNNETQIEIQNENQKNQNLESLTQNTNNNKSTVTQNSQLSLNSVPMEFGNEQPFPSFGYDLDQLEYEEQMKKEFESIMQNNGENFDTNSLFDGIDLSLLTSMTAPKLDSKLEMIKKIYLEKKKINNNNNNDNDNDNDNNNNSNNTQTNKKIFNPEYKKFEKDQIKELSKSLQQLKIVKLGDNKINENEKIEKKLDIDDEFDDDVEVSDENDDVDEFDNKDDDCDYVEEFEKILQKHQEEFSLKITTTINEKIKNLKTLLNEEK